MTNNVGPHARSFSLDDLNGDPAPLIEIMQQRIARQNVTGTHKGVLWEIANPRQVDNLTFGVRRNIGIVTWEDSEGLFIPADGTNADPVDYFTADGEHYQHGKGCEIALQTVFQAVQEFVTTRTHPTCIKWLKTED